MATLETEKLAPVDQALADIVSLFEDPAKLPAAVASALIVRQSSDAPMATWSLSNQILCLLSSTTDARGFRQWQAVGRQVKKGAHAFRILAPKVRKYREHDDETGEDIEHVRTIGFLGVPVFRVEDTEGEPIEVPDYRPATFPPLIDVAERLGVSVQYAPGAVQTPHGVRAVSDAYGFYSPASDSVTLLTHDAGTFFHELAHAAHKRVLVARGTALKGGQVPTQEIVAETCAAVLCKLYGFEARIGRSHEYITRYAGKGGPAHAVARVLADVSAVLALLLDAEPVVSLPAAA